MNPLTLLLAAFMGCGIGLVTAALSAGRVPLLRRIAPYVPSPAGSDVTHSRFTTEQLLSRLLALDPTNAERLTVRLAAAGWQRTAVEYRTHRLVCAAGGLALGIALAIVLARTRGTATPLLAIIVAASAAAGAAACDHHLNRAIRRRRSTMLAELPAVAELLALAVAAGESIHGALARVTRHTGGEVGREFAALSAHVASGEQLVEALDSRARTCPLPQLAGLYHAIATALEHGTPLAGVLQAQAADIRAAGRRALLESGGRKEIAMMVPVVFLILPVTVLFAIFPGLVSLTFLV